MRCAAPIVRAHQMEIQHHFSFWPASDRCSSIRNMEVLGTIGGALAKGSDCLSMSAQGFVDVDRPCRCPGCSEMELGESELGLSSKASGEHGTLRVRQSGVPPAEFK